MFRPCKRCGAPPLRPNDCGDCTERYIVLQTLALVGFLTIGIALFYGAAAEKKSPPTVPAKLSAVGAGVGSVNRLTV